MPNTPKQTTITLKPQNNKPKKHHFAMFKNNPQFFINFCFFEHTIFGFEKLCFAENTIKIVFSEKKHSFSKTQLVKPTFSPMSKNTFFKEKVSFLVLGNFRLIYTVLVQKKFWPKQIVCTKMRVFFSLPDTNSVRQFLLKILFFCFFTFLDDHLKKPNFYRVFWPFPFFSFFCFYFSNIKKEKKMQFSFRKPHF